jgi:hypothetical protein
MSLCYLCSKQLLIHERYIDKFITNNLHSNRNKKYIIILFRLAPYLFDNYNLTNTVLQNINVSTDIYDSFDFIFNGYFHQPELTFADYEICDSCLHYICPMHQKFNPMNYNRCHYCLKSWCICLNCMYSSTEKNMCDKIHKKQEEEEIDDRSVFGLILDYKKSDETKKDDKIN